MGSSARISRVSAELESIFPALAVDGYALSSPDSPAYNCIAWAVGESHRWWEPGIYWPVQVGNDLAALVRLFASLGYDPCEDEVLESGYEKVALYAGELDDWTNAARQLPDGWWTSKLGQGADIVHRSPQALEGSAYGQVRAIMKRATTTITEIAQLD
jgi:hypothetical protein